MTSRKSNIGMMRSLFTPSTASLIVLVVQSVSLTIMIRYSRTRMKGDDDSSNNSSSNNSSYIISTAIVTSECLKLLLNLLLEKRKAAITSGGVEGNLTCTTNDTLPLPLPIQQQQQQTKSTSSNNNNKPIVTSLLMSLIPRWLISIDSIRLAIPALLYVVQNNLEFIALQNLSVPIYYVTHQGKLLTAAFFSRTMLQKDIKPIQYIALLAIAFGVATVQLSEMDEKTTNITNTTNATTAGNRLVGFVAVFISCCTSGFAGVYFEKMAKTNVSVYRLNAQLAFWSIWLALIGVYMKDYESVKQHGFFHGYDWFVLVLCFNQAIFGIVVGLAMKYAGTLSKGVAVSVSTVVATIFSILVWHTKVDAWFIVGSAVVLASARLYYSPQASCYSFKDIYDIAIQNVLSNKGKLSGMRSTHVFFVGTMAYCTVSMLRMMPTTIGDRTLLSDRILPTSNTFLHATTQPKCKSRKISDAIRWEAPTSTDSASYSECLQFHCNMDVAKCDNTSPTNYDGPEPPCCSHILRDMAFVFDRAMCEMGFDYCVSDGSLLGLTRDDRFIAWTRDNDFTVPESTASVMWSMRDSFRKYGFKLLYDSILRICILPSFVDGKLQNWPSTRRSIHSYLFDNSRGYFEKNFVYSDIYITNTTMKAPNMQRVGDPQIYGYPDMAFDPPYIRKAVYNNTFSLNFPQNAEELIPLWYGNTWHIPDTKASGNYAEWIKEE